MAVFGDKSRYPNCLRRCLPFPAESLCGLGFTNFAEKPCQVFFTF
jgi:hypothetical protein